MVACQKQNDLELQESSSIAVARAGCFLERPCLILTRRRCRQRGPAGDRKDWVGLDEVGTEVEEEIDDGEEVAQELLGFRFPF